MVMQRIIGNIQIQINLCGWFLARLKEPVPSLRVPLASFCSGLPSPSSPNSNQLSVLEPANGFPLP
ncbi:MAG: hypothetical protein M2R45_00447 [Verrucomicrobia subdivision 3 bacterium]|nr:hypothetical protein [Limisphaerales bacterium]MCS1413673.1 hypothetical protein [Limisphaerales bacterium]